jgi:hypothetical protein
MKSTRYLVQSFYLIPQFLMNFELVGAMEGGSAEIPTLTKTKTNFVCQNMDKQLFKAGIIVYGY